MSRDDRDANSHLIAITGMGLRLPGGITDARSLRDALRNRTDGIVDIPADRWDVEKLYDADKNAAGKTTVRRGGFLDGFDQFDPAVFGISPREAEDVDPQQRLLLETAFEAFADAGLPLEAVKGTAVGVYVGAFIHDYQRMQFADRRQYSSTLATGSQMTIMANRLSYAFDLTGPSLALDTACSSSMYAVDLACRAIRSGTCERALAGGVNLILSPDWHVAMTRGGLLSPDARCHAFDARANGYVRSEGAGMMLFERLDRALAQGRPIYAVVRATDSNQDGRTQGISVPSEVAQARLFARALHQAGVEPREVGYVEAHGTGTKVGDPKETTAIGQVLSVGRDGPIRIGSIKSNIGHTESAAGIAGLAKAALTVGFGELWPNLHFETPNPDIPFDEFGLEVVTENSTWAADRRVALVNSFGYGGSNATAVVEAPPASHRHPSLGGTMGAPIEPAADAIFALPVSGVGPAARAARARQFAAALDEAGPTEAADLCHTVARHFAALDDRGVAVGRGVDGLRAALDKVANLPADPRPSSDLALVFTGMGPQWWGMGRGLWHTSPLFRETVAEIDALFEPLAGWRVADVLLMTEEVSPVQRTEYAQACIFAVQVGIFRQLRAWGVEPRGIVGHSVGEAAGLHCAGRLSLEAAVTVVYHRSRLQATTRGTGKLLAAGLSADEARARMPAGLDIAAVNSPESITIVGDEATLATFGAALEADGVFARMLKVEVPYHGAGMDPIERALLSALDGLQTADPSKEVYPYYSTVYGERLGSRRPDGAYWWQNVRRTVRFADTIQRMIDDDMGLFLDVGPHPVLGRSVAETAAANGARVATCPTLVRRGDDQVNLAHALGWLWSHHVPVELEPVVPAGRLVALPRYPWQHQTFWKETEAGYRKRMGEPDMPSVAREASNHPLLGHRLDLPTPIWRGETESDVSAFVADHVVHGQVVMPGAAYVEMVLAAMGELDGDGARVLEQVAFDRMLPVDPASPPALEVELGTGRFVVSARDGEGEWHTHAHGRTRRTQWSPPAVDPTALPAADALGADDCYRLMTHFGLRYGPAFRSIERVWRSKGRAVAQLRSAVPHDEDGWTLHPALLDSMLHVVYLALDCEETDADLRGTVCLPIGLDRLELHNPPTAISHVDARIVERLANGFIAALTAYDEGGRPIMVVHRVRCEVVDDRPHAYPAKLAGWAYVDRETGRPLPDTSTERPNFVILSAAAQARPMASRLADLGPRWSLLAPPAERAFAPLPGLERAAGGAVVWVVATDERTDEGNGPDSAGAVFAEGVALLRAARDAGVERVYACCATDDPALPVIEGLWRVASHEMASLRPTLIAVEQWADTRAVQALRDEVNADAPATEVVWRDGARHIVEQVRAPDRLALRDPVGPVPNLGLVARGGLSSVPLVALPRPAPIEGQVEVEVMSAGLNFKDVLKASGAIDRRATRDSFWRDALGMELAGVVRRVGSGVTRWQPGDRVFGFAHFAMRRFVTTDVDLLAAMPDSMSFDEAATLPVVAATVWWGLADLADVQPGERVLVHSAADGVGPVAIAIARHLGAEIVGTAGTPEERAILLDRGLSVAGDVRSASFVDTIRHRFDGEGVDVILGAVSGEMLRAGMGLLRDGGRYVDLGKLDIVRDAPLPMGDFHRNVRYIGLDLDRLLAHQPRRAAALMAAVGDLAAQGVLTPLDHVATTADDAAAAFSELDAGKHAGKRLVRFGQLAGVVAAPGPFTSWMKPDRTYLVTGGTRGFGLELARWLVERGARHLVLVSRSGARSAAGRAAIAELKAAGAEVHLPTVDVAAPDAADVLGEMLDQCPPLAGLFHGAGLLADALIDDQTAADWSRVAGVKLGGARMLERLVVGRPVEHFVLFSSVTAGLGNVGSANYVAANRVLDHLAERRAAQGLPGLSVQWGLVADVGMAVEDPVTRRALDRAGLVAMHTRDGLAGLDRLLAGRGGAVMLAPIDWSLWREANPGSGAPRFAPCLGSDDAGEADGIDAFLAGLEPADQMPALCVRIASAVAPVFRMDPTTIDHRRSLSDYGLDSLLALELRGALRGIGLSVSVSVLLGGASVRSLARQRLGAGEESAEVISGSARWFECRDPKPEAKIRLVCFPYAAGGPAVFGGWPELLGDDIELIVAHLPGRGRRISESAHTSIDASADALAAALVELASDDDRPLAMFGHCLGAIVMVEVLRRIDPALRRRVERVFVSGASAPSRYLGPELHNHTDSVLLEALGTVDFTNARALIDDDEMRQLLTPMIRADFEAAAAYCARPGDALGLPNPATIFLGRRDLFISPGQLPAWRQELTGQVTVRVCDEHHYFIETRRRALIAALLVDLGLSAPGDEAEVFAPRSFEAFVEVELAERPSPRTGWQDVDSWVRTRGQRVSGTPNIVLLPDCMGARFPVADVAALMPGARVHEVVYPGTGVNDRRSPGSEAEVVEYLDDLLADIVTGPCLLVGHGYGGLLAVELAGRRRGRAGLDVCGVIIAAVAPSHLVGYPLAHLSDDRTLHRLMKLVGHPGTDASGHAMASLDPVRAGFELAASHRTCVPEPLDVPLVGLRSHDDLWMVGHAAFGEWSRYTSETFSVIETEGCHFAPLDGWLVPVVNDMFRAEASTGSEGVCGLRRPAGLRPTAGRRVTSRS